MISQTKADWVIMVVIKQSFWFIVYSNCVWSSILRMHWCTNFQSHNSLCGLGEWSLKSLLGRGHVHCWYLTHSIWCSNSIQGSIIYLFVYSHTKRWPYLSLIIACDIKTVDNFVLLLFCQHILLQQGYHYKPDQYQYL